MRTRRLKGRCSSKLLYLLSSPDLASSSYLTCQQSNFNFSTKAIVSKEITYWNKTMLKTPQGSKLGVEWPEGTDEVQNPALKTTIFGTQYSPNCYSVPKIDSYWVPHLVDALEKRGLPKY